MNSMTFNATVTSTVQLFAQLLSVRQAGDEGSLFLRQIQSLLVPLGE